MGGQATLTSNSVKLSILTIQLVCDGTVKNAKRCVYAHREFGLTFVINRRCDGSSAACI